MNIPITRQRSIILLSLLLFIGMQYSALLHASTHFFHTHDNLCTIYSAVDHSKSGLINTTPTLAFIPVHSEPGFVRTPVVTSCYTIFLPSRAPPQ